ncbi:hypothetical protein GCM10027447_14540 [Glycomyces halotolerans]
MRPADGPGGAGAAQATAGTARREGSEVANKAAGEAKDVAHSAREEGQHLAQQAKTEVRHVADDARTQLRDEVSAQADKAGDSLRRLGEQVGALAEGRPQDAGPLAEYAQSAAEEIRHAAGRVNERGFEGILEDTKSFARKRPAAFLCVAAVAGFSIGRMLRGGTEARKERQDSSATGQESRAGAETYPPGGDTPTDLGGTGL